jgi:plasmid stability protein
MSDVLIRDIDPKALKRLKAQAKRNGRSLQNEAKLILEQGAADSDIAAIIEKWKGRFSGRKFSSSVALIREDRDR